MVFFNAREVFALLLLCPSLNQDENYLFDDAKDLQEHHHILVI